MEIITGYTGKPHVTSEQDRDVNIGVVGEGSYVLQTGMQLAAEVSSNNEIKIRDGVLMHQGCTASIKKNTYDSLTITNGSQGMKRVDLIVARYEKNQDNGIESLDLKVIQGTPAESNPAAPQYTEGDIQAGDYVADMPMYQVIIEGLNITEVKKMFKVIGSNKDLSNQLAEISKKMTGKYAHAYSAYLDNEKSTKTSLTLNSIKATGHGRKCILMCWGAMKVTTLTARLSVYVNGKESCSGITSSTSYVPVFDSNIITLPEGENTIELRLSAQANTATAYIGRYHKLGFIVAEL